MRGCDGGAGLLLVLTALFFIANEKRMGRQKLEEMTEMVFSGRYVILGMGLFAIYAGFIYNEIFGVAVRGPQQGGLPVTPVAV